MEEFKAVLEKMQVDTKLADLVEDAYMGKDVGQMIFTGRGQNCKIFIANVVKSIMSECDPTSDAANELEVHVSNMVAFKMISTIKDVHVFNVSSSGPVSLKDYDLEDLASACRRELMRKKKAMQNEEEDLVVLKVRQGDFDALDEATKSKFTFMDEMKEGVSIPSNQKGGPWAFQYDPLTGRLFHVPVDKVKGQSFTVAYI